MSELGYETVRFARRVVERLRAREGYMGANGGSTYDRTLMLDAAATIEAFCQAVLTIDRAADEPSTVIPKGDARPTTRALLAAGEANP